MGLRQGMQILDWRDKGARCDERDMFSQALQRSPAEVNFHQKNTQHFFLIKAFCENVTIWT